MHKFNRELLQLTILLVALLPVGAGYYGLSEGTAFINQTDTNPEVDCYFRNLSALFFAIGLGFLYCVPNIELKTSCFRMLAGIVLIGSLDCLYDACAEGLPTLHTQGVFLVSFVALPLLCFWQTRVAAIYNPKIRR